WTSQGTVSPLATTSTTSSGMPSARTPRGASVVAPSVVAPSAGVAVVCAPVGPGPGSSRAPSEQAVTSRAARTRAGADLIPQPRHGGARPVGYGESSAGGAPAAGEAGAVGGRQAGQQTELEAALAGEDPAGGEVAHRREEALARGDRGG